MTTTQIKTESKTGTTSLLWVTALQAEATPLIEHYRLKPCSSRAFSLFQSGNVTLIVCGIGELAAASATSLALGFQPALTVAVNIGIAGSENAIGSLHHASSIGKQQLNKDTRILRGMMYPHLPFKTNIPGLATITVDEPCTDYKVDCCHEMEAYGFCFAARQFIPAERVHCLKIISDNSQAPLVANSFTNPSATNMAQDSLSLNKADITKLVRDNLAPITRFAQQLLSSCESGSAESLQPEQLLKQRDHYIEKIEKHTNTRLHFTKAQQQQLTQLLRRYQVLGIPLPHQPDLKSSSDLIKALDHTIADQLPSYPDHATNLAIPATTNKTSHD